MTTYKANNGTAKHKWACRCDCGQEVVVLSCSLVAGRTKSCGCFKVEVSSRPKPHLATHGMTNTKEYKMFDAAKQRAKSKGLEFSLTIDDISIPTHCPVLGVELNRTLSKHSGNSPSLDRIDSSKGYTPDNVWVISNKINCAKSDLSIDVLERLVTLLKAKQEQYKEKT